MEYFSDDFFKEMTNDYDEINEYLNQSNISFYLKEDGNEERKAFERIIFDFNHYSKLFQMQYQK